MYIINNFANKECRRHKNLVSNLTVKTVEDAKPKNAVGDRTKHKFIFYKLYII